MRSSQNEADLDRLVEALATEPRVPTHSFWSSTTTPAAFRQGLLDQRRIDGFDVARRVQFGYIPHEDECKEPHFVVLLRPTNDRVIAGLSVQSGSGQALPVLPSERCLRLIVQSLDQRLRALPSDKRTTDWVPELVFRLAKLTVRQETVPAEREAIDHHQERLADRAMAVIGEGLPRDLSSFDLRDVAAFVGIAAARNLLTVEVPPDDAGVVIYEMRESIADAHTSSMRTSDRVAAAVGAIPNTLRIPLYKAGTSSGYRLEVDVGLGNFVRSIKLSDTEHAGKTGTGTQLATITTESPPDREAAVVIEIAEHPSKTLLSSTLLGIATFLGVLSAWLLRDDLASWKGDAVTVGDLGTLLGILAVGLGAIRAVVYRGLQGRTLAFGALGSALASGLILLALTAVLVWLGNSERSRVLTGLLVLAALNAVHIVSLFVLAVRRLAKLRSQSARDHPETPSST